MSIIISNGTVSSTSLSGVNRLLETPGLEAFSGEGIEGYPPANSDALMDLFWDTVSRSSTASVYEANPTVEHSVRIPLGTYGIADYPGGETEYFGMVYRPTAAINNITWGVQHEDGIDYPSYDFSIANSTPNGDYPYRVYFRKFLHQAPVNFYQLTTVGVDIAYLFTGNRIEIPGALQAGYTPPGLGYSDYNPKNFISNNGLWLGRKSSTDRETLSLNYRGLDNAFVQEAYPDIYRRMRTDSVFFVETRGAVDNAAFVASDKSVSKPTLSSVGQYDLGLKLLVLS